MTPYPTRTDESSEHGDGCFSEPCPEPREHPVHISSQASLGKTMTICPHDCPTDVHGQRHFIPRSDRDGPAPPTVPGPEHPPCEFCGKIRHSICSDCSEEICKGTCMCDMA